MLKVGLVHFLILGLSINLAIGQAVQPKGYFLEQTTKIGEEVHFVLSVKYDRSLNVLFPDSLYSFGTFEYNSRTYFNTKSDSTISFDSVVYNLSTFEIDSIQTLSLPVFAIGPEDSTAYYSNLDSVFLIHVVDSIPNPPQMMANTELVSIGQQFNYPYLLIALGIVMVIALVVIIFFGKQVRKAYRIYMMNHFHKRFIKRFFDMIRDVSGANPVHTPEHVLATWKGYMERLEKLPISKLTTKEILVLHQNSTLKDNLKAIDRSIYGGEKGNDLFASFDYLMNFSIEVYHEKVKEIKSS